MLRRKNHQLKIEKQNYRQHIIRLQKIKEGQSPCQRLKASQKRKGDDLLSNIRKFHVKSRSFRIKQLQLDEEYQKSKQKDLTKVNSVVKNAINSFDKFALTLSEKQELKKKKMQMQKKWSNNSSFYGQSNCFSATEENKFIHPDFSRIYQQSKLNSKEPKQIRVKMGKGLRLSIQFDTENLADTFKHIDEFYALNFVSGKRSFKTIDYILHEIGTSLLEVQLPSKIFEKNGIHIEFYRVLDHKELFVNSIYICAQQISKKQKNNLWLNSLSPITLLSTSYNNNQQPSKKITLQKSLKGIPKSIKFSITIYQYFNPTNTNSLHENSDLA